MLHEPFKGNISTLDLELCELPIRYDFGYPLQLPGVAAESS